MRRAYDYWQNQPGCYHFLSLESPYHSKNENAGPFILDYNNTTSILSQVKLFSRSTPVSLVPLLQINISASLNTLLHSSRRSEINPTFLFRIVLILLQLTSARGPCSQMKSSLISSSFEVISAVGSCDPPSSAHKSAPIETLKPI